LDPIEYGLSDAYARRTVAVSIRGKLVRKPPLTFFPASHA
jgi:hypothetical protein